jgi:hypothetical protein
MAKGYQIFSGNINNALRQLLPQPSDGWPSHSGVVRIVRHTAVHK